MKKMIILFAAATFLLSACGNVNKTVKQDTSKSGTNLVIDSAKNRLNKFYENRSQGLVGKIIPTPEFKVALDHTDGKKAVFRVTYGDKNQESQVDLVTYDPSDDQFSSSNQLNYSSLSVPSSYKGPEAEMERERLVNFYAGNANYDINYSHMDKNNLVFTVSDSSQSPKKIIDTVTYDPSKDTFTSQNGVDYSNITKMLIKN